MTERTNHLKIELSPRDFKFTLMVGLLILMAGLALLSVNWRLATYAPLAIMMGLFLICLVTLVSFKKTA